MRIVIVEDEPRIREGLARLVRKIDPGYEIVGEAEDGLAGLRIIAESRPDLVITDVRMPDLDGLEMLSAARGGQGQGEGDRGERVFGVRVRLPGDHARSERVPAQADQASAI